MTYREIAITVMAAIGVALLLVSAIGIVRLPDVYTRMHAAAKASTLGVAFVLLSAGIFYPDQLVIALVVIVLFFVTAPIAATTMARATYRTDPDREFILNYDDLAEHEDQRRKSQEDADRNEQAPTHVAHPRSDF
jgi:multicomponent Na+:H+ antiporter subunit G